MTNPKENSEFVSTGPLVRVEKKQIKRPVSRGTSHQVFRLTRPLPQTEKLTVSSELNFPTTAYKL